MAGLAPGAVAAAVQVDRPGQAGRPGGADWTEGAPGGLRGRGGRVGRSPGWGTAVTLQ